MIRAEKSGTSVPPHADEMVQMRVEGLSFSSCIRAIRVSAVRSRFVFLLKKKKKQSYPFDPPIPSQTWSF